jgi:hypothetical protein
MNATSAVPLCHIEGVAIYWYGDHYINGRHYIVMPK